MAWILLRLDFADGTRPSANDCISGAAARHEAPRFYRNEMQAAHDGGEAARGARGRRRAKQIEQGGRTDGILAAHLSLS
jgi:hypothetical protein